MASHYSSPTSGFEDPKVFSIVIFYPINLFNTFLTHFSFLRRSAKEENKPQVLSSVANIASAFLSAIFLQSITKRNYSKVLDEVRVRSILNRFEAPAFDSSKNRAQVLLAPNHVRHSAAASALMGATLPQSPPAQKRKVLITDAAELFAANTTKNATSMQRIANVKRELQFVMATTSNSSIGRNETNSLCAPKRVRFGSAEGTQTTPTATASAQTQTPPPSVSHDKLLLCQNAFFHLSSNRTLGLVDVTATNILSSVVRGVACRLHESMFLKMGILLDRLNELTGLQWTARKVLLHDQPFARKEAMLTGRKVCWEVVLDS